MTIDATDDRVHIKGNTVTAATIVANLRAFGASCKVLLVAKDNYTLNNDETGIIEGKKGLLTLYHKDFTAVRPNRQMTHKDGGIIEIITEEHLGGAVMRGIRYSVVVIEGGNIAEKPMIYNDVRTLLTTTPRLWVESKEGKHGELLWLTR